MPKPPHLPSVQRDARALRDAGNAEAARNLLAQAIEAARPAYGSDHPDVLLTQHLLAQLHAQNDDPVKARRILEEALAEGQRRWGDADQVILTMSYDLGTIAEELGNRHEARRNFTRVATHGPAVLGADHWTIQAARKYLGEAAPPAATSGTAAMPDPPPPPSVSPPPPPVGPSVSAPPAVARPGPPPSVPPPGPNRPTPPVPPPPVVSPPAAPTTGAPPGPFPPALPRTGVTTAGGPTVAPPPDPIGPATGYGPVQPTTGGAGFAVASGPPAYPVMAPQPTQPAADPRPAGSGRSGSLLLLTVALTVLTVVIVGVGAAILLNRDADPPAGPGPSRPGPIASGPPPADLRLRDDRNSVTVSWTDPTDGTVPFVVAGGRAGQHLSAMGSVPAGQSRYTISGLSPNLDYCFTVLAAYGTESFATSSQVCTSRGGQSPG